MTRLRIEAGAVRLEIELRETATARALAAAAPFEARAQTWGEEVYFATPVSAALEADAQQVVEPGTVCFWTEGRALALPFGRTPLSSDARPTLAARCNIVGRIAGDYSALGRIRAGDRVRVAEA